MFFEGVHGHSVLVFDAFQRGNVTVTHVGCSFAVDSAVDVGSHVLQLEDLVGGLVMRSSRLWEVVLKGRGFIMTTHLQLKLCCFHAKLAVNEAINLLVKGLEVAEALYLDKPVDEIGRLPEIVE